MGCFVNMCDMFNITFQVLRCSTFVVNKGSEEKNIHDYICCEEITGFWLE